MLIFTLEPSGFTPAAIAVTRGAQPGEHQYDFWRVISRTAPFDCAGASHCPEVSRVNRDACSVVELRCAHLGTSADRRERSDLDPCGLLGSCSILIRPKNRVF